MDSLVHTDSALVKGNTESFCNLKYFHRYNKLISSVEGECIGYVLLFCIAIQYSVLLFCMVHKFCICLPAHYESLQDKLAQLRDAREALNALRDEHREKKRREMEEMERLRQIQMAQKLEIMRQKKHVCSVSNNQVAASRHATTNV